MKRIVIVSASPFYSGAEISLNQLLEQIDSKFELLIITGNKANFKNIKAVDFLVIDSIINRNSWFKLLIKSIFINYKCFTRIIKFKPEIIYFNTTNSFVNLFWIGILFFRANKIWHVRDVLKEKWITNILSNLSDTIVCNSKYINNQLHVNSKSITIYGGIDLMKYTTEKANAISELIDQTKYQTVVCIAQLTPWKNHIDFIKAAKIIHAENPDVRFVLVGDILNPKDTSYKERLLQEVKDSGLSEIIKLIGFHDNIVEILSCIDVLIHPAINEPFGRVLIEAMAMEKPIVAYRCGGPKEIVDDEKSGYIVKPYDYQSLANKTMILLENDTLRLNFGQEGRKRVIEKFTLQRHKVAMEELFMNSCKS